LMETYIRKFIQSQALLVFLCALRKWMVPEEIVPGKASAKLISGQQLGWWSLIFRILLVFG